ncbi:MAG: response regulator [Candidatus Auribacter fodinae]|jgi:CheY-like chemotaxis protein|uniref:Response regulator n=1 Tax=Candidatus Auribacter fodinae TaxID=2093366 RepID=A0A3A4RCU9_9BACT|nr:MAG: response regulator [Candidatus Auribacter fodinae]
MKNNNRVLYIEDNSDDLYYFQYLLNKIDKSIHLVSVNNGEDAIDMLSDKPDDYRAIFLDIKLPKYNAFEILEKLTELNISLPTDKIIILTTSSNERDIKLIQQMGINKFFFKPISENTLRSFFTS